MADMEYRRLGRSGLQVSVLSFGSWVSFGAQLDTDAALGCLDVAYQGGMNFFDNAEAYAGGESERIMGEAIAQLGWPRHSYVISTKLFWGIHGGVNMSNTLNRKYLLQAIEGSLERLDLEFVDLLYCHRADPNTPLEETVWAMSDIVVERPGDLLGHVGVDRRRDPRRVGHRRAPPPAQAGGGAARVQRAQPAAGRA